MKKLLVFVAVMLVLLTGCAPGTDVEVEVPDTTIRLTSPGPNPQLNEPDADGRLAGLGQGLWHGLIAPITLIGSFFNENSQIYEVHNNGLEYNVGFMIGVALIFLLLGIFGGRWR
jgi:hypothetical protein